MVNTKLIETPMIQEQMAWDVKNYPLGRYGDPRDVALAIIYLLSDGATWVTGTNLIVDGGLTTK